MFLNEEMCIRLGRDVGQRCSSGFTKNSTKTIGSCHEEFECGFASFSWHSANYLIFRHGCFEFLLVALELLRNPMENVNVEQG